MRWLDTASLLLTRVLKRWSRLVAKKLGIFIKKTRWGVEGRPRPGVFDRRWRKLVLNLLGIQLPRPYRTFNALQLEYHGQDFVL